MIRAQGRFKKNDENYMNNKLLESTTSFTLSRVHDQRGNISFILTN